MVIPIGCKTNVNDSGDHTADLWSCGGGEAVRGIMSVSLWQTILTMLLTYNMCLKSMLFAHNYLSVAQFQTLLRQEDLIWASESSERPDPHSSLPGGFWATAGIFCLAFE